MPSEPLFDIVLEQRDGWTIALVSGELDMATTPRLESVCTGLYGAVAVDLSRVRFLDSTGLRSLVRLRERHDRLVLIAPSVPVQRLLDLTQLAAGFSTVQSVEELGAV